MDGGKARITVIGSYAVGMTISCARFPTEGETVPGRNFNMLHGGKGSNQAIAVARLGGAAVFGTAVGTDTFGDQAIAMLKDEGIGIDFVTRKPGHSTGVGLVMVSDKGQQRDRHRPRGQRCPVGDRYRRHEGHHRRERSPSGAARV